MTSRLKTAREPPLLAAPTKGVEPWRRVTQSDVDAANFVLAGERLHGMGESVLMLHHFLKELGFPQAVTGEDRKAVENRLKALPWHGRVVAEIRYGMRLLGWPGDATPAEERTILATVEDARKRNNGLVLAELHYYLKGLGRPMEVTAEDERIMLTELEGFRQKKDGLRLARMHHHLAEIGLSKEIPPGDRQMMKDQLNESRRKREGYVIVEMHYILNRLFPPDGTQEARQMPQLKRFGK